MEDAVLNLRRRERMYRQMKDEKDNLILNIQNVMWRIAEAATKTEKVNDVVSEWLNDAHKLIKKVEIWDNPERKFELYDKMLYKIKTQNSKCKFEPFSIPIPTIEYSSSTNFVCLNSTKVASDQLLEALSDKRNHIIELYGDKGSGKTELVKAVGEKAKYLKIFDAILFATVSENPNVSIQDQIVDSMNLKLDKNTEGARAIKIYLKLESKDSILVILDDVREYLELDGIGIPCNGNRCKVLLTTRRQQECIHDDSSSNLLDVARKVALECKGLPSTIKDVGSSLKCKPIKEWEAFSLSSFVREGFKTFMDKDGLEGGNQISRSLIKASRLSIIVFSKNYAYSSWCLDELVTILECMKKKHQEVLPIFYKVVPSDVRHQKNIYGEAMAKHEKAFENDSERVKRWRSALSEASNLSGMHYTTEYEYEFIQMIVESVSNMKNRLYLKSKDIN
ncbi:probable disease resistance protein At1g61190 [Abrus precatorius]|uniref:Probable disease resistance protein At1g61190 n=1 Tax=Abrus precatorius TaxID=3816 RepID=A0A8B8KGS7_ABRPR|nr:probable disease resistance protein At1g61190 [Abrus precatorius]